MVAWLSNIRTKKLSEKSACSSFKMEKSQITLSAKFFTSNGVNLSLKIISKLPLQLIKTSFTCNQT